MEVCIIGTPLAERDWIKFTTSIISFSPVITSLMVMNSWLVVPIIILEFTTNKLVKRRFVWLMEQTGNQDTVSVYFVLNFQRKTRMLSFLGVGIKISSSGTPVQVRLKETSVDPLFVVTPLIFTMVTSSLVRIKISHSYNFGTQVPASSVKRFHFRLLQVKRVAKFTQHNSWRQLEILL